jgi:hypothetical protein
MRRGQLVVCAAAVLLVGRVAAGQESGQVGVTMGYPGAVGVLWHLTTRVALEPEIAFSRNRMTSTFESGIIFGTGFTTTTVTSESTSEGWTVSPGINVRFYVGKWDNVSTYVASGYSYHRTLSTSTSTSSALIGVPGVGSRSEVVELRSETHDVRGMFGVQYAPHRKFSVFGEVGLRYSTADLPQVMSSGVVGIGSLNRSGTTSSFGNASAVGIAFYF